MSDVGLSETSVRINSRLLSFTFDEPDGAEAFVVELNAVVGKWLPWAQAMLGSFADTTNEEED